MLNLTATSRNPIHIDQAIRTRLTLTRTDLVLSPPSLTPTSPAKAMRNITTSTSIPTNHHTTILTAII